MLGDYRYFFETDLDELWIEYDYDNGGTLDMEECRDFLRALVSRISL